MFNRIRTFVNQVATVVEVAKTQANLVQKNEMVFPTTLHGYRVFVNDDVVFVKMLSRELPLALAAEVGKSIWVNKAFLKAPEYFQKAVLSHEEGHLKLNHMARYEGKTTLQKILMGRDLNCEYEADRYSATHGNDMLGALKLLLSLVPEAGAAEIRFRIEKLHRTDVLS